VSDFWWGEACTCLDAFRTFRVQQVNQLQSQRSRNLTTWVSYIVLNLNPVVHAILYIPLMY
jgi:hypothetical protein